jgi:hypothetical protein
MLGGSRPPLSMEFSFCSSGFAVLKQAPGQRRAGTTHLLEALTAKDARDAKES